jgi:hypothetical protein
VRFLRGVAEHESGRRHDQQVAVFPAVTGQPALDVVEEGLAVLQRAMSAEDDIGRGRGELTTLVGIAGLDDDRLPLGGAAA